MLAALTAQQTFADGQTLVLDARGVGLAAAAVALMLRAPFLVVVGTAVVVTAGSGPWAAETGAGWPTGRPYALSVRSASMVTAPPGPAPLHRAGTALWNPWANRRRSSTRAVSRTKRSARASGLSAGGPARARALGGILRACG
ncbi:hypothetical protein ACR6C2_33730 [Streptomyces sp. INA 01156]